MRSRLATALVASVLFASSLMAASTGCSSSATAPAAGPACDLQVDRFKEIMIVEDSVIADPRSRNDGDGVWSFRRRIEEATPPGQDPAATAVALFETWTKTGTVNFYPLPARMGANKSAICNWLKATASNGCDDACQTCTAKKFDLARAPVRLMAISNRGDLRAIQNDPNAIGEARFVYALTSGAGDDPASPALNMSFIFEYRQVLRGRTTLDIDQRWHALGAHATFDESYKADLESLMKTFHEPGADPTRPLGSALGQLRTNEREFDWAWDMRQFDLSDQGFVQAGTENTPDAKLSSTPDFATFLTANKEAVLAGKHVLPPALTGGAIGVLSDWVAPNVETAVVDAFAAETCNGCHQKKEIVDFNFHISPYRNGVAKLSPFLNDPANPGHDELARRETFLQTNLCGK